MMLELGPKKFVRRYQAEVRALLEITKAILDRPTPKEVHDLRVAARRIQTMRRLLPRGVRRSRVSETSGLVLKTVLKRTSELRDLDTLMSTLEAHRTSLPGDLLVALRNQRSDAAARARVACDLLADSPPPDIDRSAVRGRRISKRLRKGTKKHARAAVRLLPEVLGDESKVDELHALRLEVKKLRYLLELPDRRPPETDLMTRWQESLGAIHDLDVALEFLRKREIGLKGWAMEDLRRSRRRNYQKFLEEYAADSIEELGSSAILPGCPMPASL